MDSLLSRDRIAETIETLASKPHRAGTAANAAVGDAIIRRLQSAGYRVKVTSFKSRIPEATQIQLRVLHPNERELDVHEASLDDAPFSSVAAEQLPYFAYSNEGPVEGEVFYANYGRQEDYEYLRRNGIDPAGKIALLRSQGLCRSMKAAIAKEQGVAGIILYPEPRDQGFRKSAYPDGPFLNRWTIQRGSLLKYFIHPGDPDAAPAGSTSTLSDMCGVPVSYQVASYMFQNLAGSRVPAEWRGWLRQRYRTGPGPLKIRIAQSFRNDEVTLRNIVGYLPASNTLDNAIIIGNHYDAWVYGAADPTSGTAVVLETATALAALRAKGWNPSRPVVFGFWDGEELGMHGSTRWVKENVSSQSRPAVYVNVDTAVRARDFAAYVTPGLDPPMDEALKYVVDHRTSKTLYEVRAQYQLPGFSGDAAPFLGLAGVPSVQLGFGRSYSLYHSLYDDFDWYSRYADPNFHYTTSLAKILSLYVHAVSSSKILPFSFTRVADASLENLQDLLKQNQSKELMALISEVRQYRTVAEQFENRNIKTDPSPQLAAKVNPLIRDAFQLLLLYHDASPSRPMALNTALVGPSYMTGCAGEIFPALQKQAHNGTEASVHQEVNRLKDRFGRSRRHLEQAIAFLN